MTGTGGLGGSLAEESAAVACGAASTLAPSAQVSCLGVSCGSWVRLQGRGAAWLCTASRNGACWRTYLGGLE